MLNDTLSNALSTILNHENVAKKQCKITPVNKIITRVLTLLNKNLYIGAYDQTSEARGGSINVHLIGKINKCGAIKPRYSVQVEEYEKFEKRYLPAFGMGILIVSTSKGFMTHREAKEQHLGGKLIAYCY
jgi:small subunit ribosomal protein S8